jgi:flagellar biosynthetic protein FliO
VVFTLLPATAGAAEAWSPATPDWTRGLIAIVVVLALAAGCAWLLRRGLPGPLGRRRQKLVTTETVALLGERRSLVVVTVEGRRLLLGVTPAQVSLVTELHGSGSFDRALGDTLTHQAERTA